MSSSEELAAFLAARLDEDEAAAWSVHDVSRCDALLYEEDMPAAAASTPDCDCGYPARVRREVEAGRRRLRRWTEHNRLAAERRADGRPSPATENIRDACWVAVLDDAAVWCDHPGYRQEWAPATG